MARLLLVSDGIADLVARVPALAGSPHALARAPLSLRALDVAADVVLLDATGDPAAAGRLAPLLANRPVVVLVDDRCAALVTPAWQPVDVLHIAAGAPELELRLRLLLAPSAPRRLEADGLVIDEAAYRATVTGQPLDLTYTEFELLKFLVANPRRVHSREQLLADVWGHDYFGGTRTVDVHVRRLRAKLGPEHDALIETVRNVGYRFSPR